MVLIFLWKISCKFIIFFYEKLIFVLNKNIRKDFFFKVQKMFMLMNRFYSQKLGSFT
jgi:hypothetical protein